MAIYGISGNALTRAYSKSGNVNIAYNRSGSVVFSDGETPETPEWDYTSYAISDLFQYGIAKAQAFAIYDGKIAQVREDDSLHIVDIETQTSLKHVTMDMGHGNSCQFSNEFYDVSDEFPLFYIRNSGIWVYRIVGTDSTLIRKYKFPTSDVYTYVAGFGVDSPNRRIYTVSYTEGDYITKTGQLCICKYDMDNIIDNGDGTCTMTLLRRNTFPWFDRYNAVQGCCYKNGYLFVATGYTGNSNQDIVMIDKRTLSIVNTISLGQGNEIEGCGWVDNDYMIVGQKINYLTYKKIEFNEVT